MSERWPQRKWWPGDAAEQLDGLRRAVAELIGADPETWPAHGNAPLAIASAVALGEAARAGEAVAPQTPCGDEHEGMRCNKPRGHWHHLNRATGMHWTNPGRRPPCDGEPPFRVDGERVIAWTGQVIGASGELLSSPSRLADILNDHFAAALSTGSQEATTSQSS